MSDPKVSVWRLQLPRFTEEPFRPYATAIGQAALAWNDLHEHLGRLFGGLLPTKTRDQPFAIWQSSRVDRAKRDMLAAAAMAVRDKLEAHNPSAYADIAWILEHATKLEDARNNAVHAPLQLVLPLAEFGNGTTRANFWRRGMVEPLAMGGNKRAIQVERKDLLAELIWCRDTALALRTFTLSIDNALDSPTQRTWPGRPKLPVRRAPRKRKPPPPQERQ